MKKIILTAALLFVTFISNVSFAQLASHVVIAEVYTGGGTNSSSTYTNDYVVLYNPTGSSVDLSTWSLQRELGSIGGWDQIVNLVGSIPANSYYMVQGASANSNGVPLPVVPSASLSTFNLEAAASKVALVNDQIAISGIVDVNVVDFVGYGTATSYEGTGPASAPSVTQSIRRENNTGGSDYNITGSGWDSDNNNSDFYVESSLIANPPAGQSFLSNHVVIAEIYGGGGNSTPDAPYLYDYIVLYNPTGSPIDVSSWSIQYKAAATTTGNWSSVNLLGSISPLSYYMIQLGGTANGPGAPLPVTPNVTGSFTISVSSGKVALVNNQTVLIGDPTLPNANIEDFVGYGTSASVWEGGGKTPAPSNTSSVRRRDNTGGATYGTNGSGWDSDNNDGDFYEEFDLIANEPLPVELSSFTASIIGTNVKLSWRTETEVNNYGFEVERTTSPKSPPSQGGEDEVRGGWEKIGFVNGNGNSNSPKDYSFVDNSAANGSYSYRLKQIDNDGQFEYSKTIEVVLGAPIKFELSQNYPNPFNPTTTIKFTMPEAGNVKLTLYNILGQEVKTLVNSFKEAGVHTVDFSATDGASELNSGIYIYKIEAGSFVQTRKMTLLK